MYVCPEPIVICEPFQEKSSKRGLKVLTTGTQQVEEVVVLSREIL